MNKTQNNATCHGAQLCFWTEDMMINDMSQTVEIPCHACAPDSGHVIEVQQL